MVTRKKASHHAKVKRPKRGKVGRSDKGVKKVKARTIVIKT